MEILRSRFQSEIYDKFYGNFRSQSQSEIYDKFYGNFRSQSQTEFYGNFRSNTKQYYPKISFITISVAPQCSLTNAFATEDVLLSVF